MNTTAENALREVYAEISKWRDELAAGDLCDRWNYALWDSANEVIAHLDAAMHAAYVGAEGVRLFHVRKAHDILFILHRAVGPDGIQCFNNGSAPVMLDLAVASGRV